MATVAKEEDNQSEEPKISIQRDRSGLFGLHVSNISPEINELDLHSLFQSSGSIKLCRIIKTMENVRVAFIKFSSHDEAVGALKKTNGTKFGGSIIEVRPAYESHKLKGNRHYKEKCNSSESLSKFGFRERDGNQNMMKPVHNGRTNPKYEKDEKKLEEKSSQKSQTTSTETRQNNTLYVMPSASEDVRYINSSSDICTPTTSSPARNCVQNPPGSRGSEIVPGNNSVQVYSSDSSSMGAPRKAYDQNQTGSRAEEMAMGGNILPVYSQTINSPNFTVPHAHYSTASKPVFSTGRYSPPKRCSYQNSPAISTCPETPMRCVQNGGRYHDGMNKMDGNSYTMHNGIPSPKFNPAHDITKTMKDLKISHPGVPPHSRPNVSKWSVGDVIKYFNAQEECSKSMLDFLEEQEIDGNALLLLEHESLLHFMKLGPALKLLNLRDKLKNM